MEATIRESALGQIVRLVTRNRYFQYPEEKGDFQCPWEVAGVATQPEKDIDVLSSAPVSIADNDDKYEREEIVDDEEKLRELNQLKDLEKQATEIDVPPNPQSARTRSNNMSRTTTVSRTRTREQTTGWTVERYETEQEEAAQKVQSTVIMPQKTSDGAILVDWYTTDDPENPQNWSLRKKSYVMLQLWLYTFTVYCASAIYTPSEAGVMEAFGVGIPKAALGLSVYVLGYGTGPMIFSPLSEIPRVGRNIPYITTFSLFVILSVPLALVDNYAGLLILRFLTGFFGSPCLATGGATIQDMFDFLHLPYAFTVWVAAAFCAPALGPLLSGFAVTALNWRWSLWIIIMMTGPVCLLMIISFPETSAPNILLRRAQRLRAKTGNSNYRAQSEIDQANMTFASVTKEALYKPMLINFLDPAVFFTNMYTALIYGIYYSFFEAFPLVYINIYGFTVGTMGVAFTCIVVACVIGIAIYCSYVNWYLIPDIMKNGVRSQEHRLVPALFASMGLPAGLFIFAWASRASVHWIVSIIGITLFGSSAFVLMQCVFIYLPMSYPQYAASLFAANDLWRSLLAAGSIIYAHPLFVNLGIGPGVSLLGGLACGGVVGIWLLWVFGARLRARSKFAASS